MHYVCRTILAPTVIGSAVYYLASRSGLTYKPFLVLCGIIVGWPIKISLGARYESWYRERRARASGAVVASQSRRKPFSASALQELREINKNGFIGELTRLADNPCTVLSDTALTA